MALRSEDSGDRLLQQDIPPTRAMGRQTGGNPEALKAALKGVDLTLPSGSTARLDPDSRAGGVARLLSNPEAAAAFRAGLGSQLKVPRDNPRLDPDSRAAGAKPPTPL